MKGFKGFDKDMKCRGLQYETGKTAVHEGTMSLCKSGLHFCEHPLDTWGFYAPQGGNRYAEVDADGVSDEIRDDTKRVARSVTVRAEVKMPALLKAAVEFVFNKVKSSPAHSATTGNYAQSSVKGKQAIAASFGVAGQAKGEVGSWMVLAEWEDGRIKAMGIACINGKKIKADTFYELKNGKFTEAK